MLNYIILGANDMEASDRFYSALLVPLGYAKCVEPEGLIFKRTETADREGNAVTIYVKTPYDKKPATAGNGSMTAFRARSYEAVRQIHAAALMAGGTDEGPPGFRAEYSKDFFVGYVRDPLGNKFAVFSTEPEDTR